jgi:hypothetical protein
MNANQRQYLLTLNVRHRRRSSFIDVDPGVSKSEGPPLPNGEFAVPTTGTRTSERQPGCSLVIGRLARQQRPQFAVLVLNERMKAIREIRGRFEDTDHLLNVCNILHAQQVRQTGGQL